MTKVRRINVSQIEGDNANNDNADEIRPYGDIALYQGDNNKLELLIADGVRTNVRNKVLAKGTFYGGDADSGDGIGFDTIKLVPDEILRRNGSHQYIVVDPTSPNHIHIRAGGTQDNSNADLFVGGEKNFVRVSDGYDSVAISTDDNNGGTKLWTFDSAGKLVLPLGSTIDETTTQQITPGATITVNDLQTLGTATWGSPVINADNVVTTGWDYVGFSNQTLYDNLIAAGITTNGVYPAAWSAGSTLSNGYVLVQFTGGINFQFTTVVDAGAGSNTPQPGTWYFPVSIGGSSTTVVNLELTGEKAVKIKANNSIWEFNNTGNLIIPLGGTINWYDGSNALVGGGGFGVTGPTGPQGNVGVTGSQGDTGPTGPTGPSGSSYSNANVASYLSGSVTVGDLSSNGFISGTTNLIINSANGQPEGGQIIIGWKGINGITGQSNSTWNMDVDDNDTYRLFYQNAIGGTNVMLSASPTTNIVTLPAVIKTTPVAFASLPTAATAGAGARAFVTDSTTNTFGTQVSGGGIYYIPVFSNGTNWYVG